MNMIMKTNVNTNINVNALANVNCMATLGFRNYRRNWLLSACAYNTQQQENMRLIKSMRLTGSMCLIKSAKTR